MDSATTAINLKPSLIFTARCYASVALAMGLCLSVRVRVRLSVTSRSSTKTAERIELDFGM